jgi:DNA-binding NarL/FixJ family response regulator
MATQIRVLLAEDSEVMRRAITSLLVNDRTVSLIGEVSSYPERLEKLTESGPDVVLIDVHMPGLREAESFKDQLRHACLLAMSFWADEETSRLAEGFGAFRLLDKCELVQTLIPTIHECVQQNGKSQPA